MSLTPSILFPIILPHLKCPTSMAMVSSLPLQRLFPMACHIPTVSPKGAAGLASSASHPLPPSIQKLVDVNEQTWLVISRLCFFYPIGLPLILRTGSIAKQMGARTATATPYSQP
jgi:hypothetical protein